MTDEKNTERAKSSKSMLDVLTGKIAKISALITAIVALLIGVQKIYENLVIPKQNAKPKDCLSAAMQHPPKVAVSEWGSMNLRLEGQNECAETLNVHVAFKARSSSIRIGTRFDCSQLDDPKCWEQHSLDKGPVDWKVSPPSLRILKSPLGDAGMIDINWIIYNAETRTQVRANKATIQVLDDPVRPEGTAVDSARFWGHSLTSFPDPLR